MSSRLKRIIEAYKEVVGSNYVVPFSQMTEQFPYYTEQELTDTHIQLDSPYGGGDGSYDAIKQFIYDDSPWQNVDWGGGNFSSPKENYIQREFNRTDNNPQNLYDPLRGASISDLNSRTASAIDNFLSSNSYIKVSNMDLNEFLKVSDEALIHKSSQDLWKMIKDKEGNIYISRLFEGDDILKS